MKRDIYVGTLREQWQHPSRFFADLLRVGALASVLGAALSQPVEGAVRFAAIFLLLLASRSRVPGPLDAAFAAALLVSSWANALQWYMNHPWVDIPTHFATNGASAAVAFFVLAETGILPRHGTDRTWNTLVVAMMGATLSVVWEIYEWTASRFIPNEMVVGYSDTIGDQTVGTLGSVLAGLLVARWMGSGRHPDWSQRTPSAA
jgi:hypothetical protein